MRLFLKRLLVFLLLLAAVLPPADFLFSRRARLSTRPSIEGWYNLLYGQIDADLVILGSSRAKNHVDPDILDSVLHTNSYNLGMSGTRIEMQLAQYELYRAHNKKPDVIVHCIDVFSLLPMTRVYNREQYFPFLWDRDFRKKVFPLVRFTLAERFIPFFRYYPTYMSDLLHRDSSSTRKGFHPLDLKWDSPTVKPVPFGMEERERSLFEQYVEKASNEGIRMVFVLPPLYYRKQVQNLDKMLDYYTELGNRYQIPLLNYYPSEICRDSTNFMDSNHLNRQGAEAFSDSLARDLLVLKENGRL